MKEYRNSDMFRLIDEYIHHARDRKIMKDRLLNGDSLEAIAEKHEMSVSQIQRIVQEYQRMLMEMI